MRILAPLLLLATAGCLAVGPSRVHAEQLDYNEAVARTDSAQLLLNVVRLLYRDRPYFLTVGSVSTQYELSRSGGLSATFPDGPPDNSLTASADLSYVEKPTVTYTPLQGEDAVKQFLSPITLPPITLMLQSGWSVARVLRCCVQSVNGVPNAKRAAGPTPDDAPEYEAFHRLVADLRALQRDDGIALGVNEDGQTVLRFRADGDVVKEQLGLDPARDEFPLVVGPGLEPRADAIVLETRSLFSVMYYLSQGVEVPERDRVDGLVTTTVGADGAPFDWGAMFADLFRVRSGAERPARAAVAVRYRGSWFWVDDADLQSKSTFALLAALFSLQAGNVETVIPALTLPVG